MGQTIVPLQNVHMMLLFLLIMPPLTNQLIISSSVPSLYIASSCKMHAFPCMPFHIKSVSYLIALVCKAHRYTANIWQIRTMKPGSMASRRSDLPSSWWPSKGDRGKGGRKSERNQDFRSKAKNWVWKLWRVTEKKKKKNVKKQMRSLSGKKIQPEAWWATKDK